MTGAKFSGAFLMTVPGADTFNEQNELLDTNSSGGASTISIRMDVGQLSGGLALISDSHHRTYSSCCTDRVKPVDVAWLGVFSRSAGKHYERSQKVYLATRGDRIFGLCRDSSAPAPFPRGVTNIVVKVDPKEHPDRSSGMIIGTKPSHITPNCRLGFHRPYL